MQATLDTPTPPATGAQVNAPVLVVVDGLAAGPAKQAAAAVEAGLRARFPGNTATVLVTGWENGEVVVRAPDAAATPAPALPGLVPSLTAGGIEAHLSALMAVLRAGVEARAAVLALVSASPHDESADWLGTFLSPVLEGGFDFVTPAYLRHKGDGSLNTGIVYPLTRALYGRPLRQPLGGEAALSGGFARRLVNEAELQRDAASAGSDAWLVARALTADARVCQAWLGAWPQHEPSQEDVSQTLARVLGMVYREMERHADRWQRVRASTPVQSFGRGGLLEGGAHAPVDRFVASFQLGERELAPIWSQVLPPATRVALRRAAAMDSARFRIEDTTWARIVYDFAVAHYSRAVERRQLLLSLTPLYLGWAASFANETSTLDAAATEARVDQLCAAFEREKPYLISRWRWPDGFTP